MVYFCMYSHYVETWTEQISISTCAHTYTRLKQFLDFLFSLKPTSVFLGTS